MDSREQKIFNNTTCYILLQGLPNCKISHFFNARSFPYHTLLSLNALHFSFLCYNHYQTFPFFSLALLNIRFLSPLVSFFLVFLPHRFYSAMSSPQYLGEMNHNFFIHFSTPFKPKSAMHNSLVGIRMCWTTCGGCRTLQTMMSKNLLP